MIKREIEIRLDGEAIVRLENIVCSIGF